MSWCTFKLGGSRQLHQRPVFKSWSPSQSYSVLSAGAQDLFSQFSFVVGSTLILSELRRFIPVATLVVVPDWTLTR